MKKLLSILLAMCLMLAMCAVATAEAPIFAGGCRRRNSAGFWMNAGRRWDAGSAASRQSRSICARR